MEGKCFVAAYTGQGEQLDEKSLHLAIQTKEVWQELNFGIGVLFAKADFEKGIVPGITKLMENPVLFRIQDIRYWEESMWKGKEARGIMLLPKMNMVGDSLTLSYGGQLLKTGIS